LAAIEEGDTGEYVDGKNRFFFAKGLIIEVSYAKALVKDLEAVSVHQA